MARHARLKLANQPWHVRQRGIDGCRTFTRDGERRQYLELLADHSKAHGCEVHAYVLMSNHVHLLVTPADDGGVSRMMKAIGERYVRRFNRAHRRSGTLWDGRFRSTIVDSRSYLFTCQRYIELNPVRAGMVSHPGDYEWSSYRVNAEGHASDVITPHALFRQMAETDGDRHAMYRALYRKDMTSEELYEIREAILGGFALGGPVHLWEIQSNSGLRAHRLRRSGVSPA